MNENIKKWGQLFHKILKLSVLFASLLQTMLVNALPPMNLPYGVTPISREMYQLHMITMAICTVIGVAVFSVLFYSLYKYRKSKGAVAADFHEHLGIEIAWTLIPFLILLALAIPATLLLKKIDDTNNPALNILVKGYQWRWQYKYLDDGFSFFSNLSTPQNQIDGQAKKGKWFLLEVDHPLVVPVNEKIRLLMTSNDVIHSWWVPALGIKQDAIPGYINENWIYITKPGIYRGQCAELCGALHGFMPIVVKAVSKLQFANWVAAHHKQAFVSAPTTQHHNERSA